MVSMIHPQSQHIKRNLHINSSNNPTKQPHEIKHYQKIEYSKNNPTKAYVVNHSITRSPAHSNQNHYSLWSMLAQFQSIIQI